MRYTVRMLKVLCSIFTFFFVLNLWAQQTLQPRVAVYNTDAERYVVDSVEFQDSVLVLYVGELSFEIAEERFARLEPISGASFSRPAQVYSFSLKNGETVVGQVTSYKRNVISIRLTDETSTTILRDEIQTLHREKRNIFEKPHVRKCATTNFISSPFALNRGEVVFTSNIYANTLEVGLGNGFSVKGLSSVLPFILPTGYEFAYRKRLPATNFSIGFSAGQVWLDPTGALSITETINSEREFINILSPSFTYHMGDSYLKTSMTMLSGSSLFRGIGSLFTTTTYSAPGIKKAKNRWNATANLSLNDRGSNNGLRAFLLVGHQINSPTASVTLGLIFLQIETVGVVPSPYINFSLYESKEQRRVSKAFKMHRRMKLLKRSLDLRNSRLKNERKRREAREARKVKRLQG